MPETGGWWGNGPGGGRWGRPDGPRAPPADPLPRPIAPATPRARSLDLATGPEALSSPSWRQFRRRLGRELAADPRCPPSRQCRTASARTRGRHLAADRSGGCGCVGRVLGRGGRVGGGLPYVVVGCWLAQLAQLAQPWAKDPALGPCMAPSPACLYTPRQAANAHVSRSVVMCMGTYCPKGHLHSVSLPEYCC